MKDFAFVDIYGDVHVVFLRRNCHLRRLDLEICVAAIHVVRAQPFQITRQRFARVAVVLLVPREPIGRLQIQGFENVVFLEFGVADQVDLFNLGPFAFLDVYDHIDLVTGQLSDLGVDPNRVLAAAEVLIGEILLHFVEHGPVESLAGGQSDIAQALLQILGFDVLVAFELEFCDRRTLDHHDQQGIAVAAQLDVTKESSGVQRAHGLADPRLIEMIAYAHRQIIEYRALGYPLQSIDADVTDGEQFLRRIRTC